MYEIQSKEFIKHINNKQVDFIKGLMMENLKEIFVK